MALKNSTRLSVLAGVEQIAATRFYQHLRLRLQWREVNCLSLYHCEDNVLLL